MPKGPESETARVERTIDRSSVEEKAGGISGIGRRTFLQGIGAALAVGWISAETQAAAYEEKIRPSDDTNQGILSLHLQAPDLATQARFYRKVMGFRVETQPSGLKVQGGGTLIHFSPAPVDEQPIYHLAWAIPANLFPEAKNWLSARTPLLVHPDGRDEFHFRRVQRRAVYFADPAGNVLELIARDGLGDHQPGPFSQRHILYVNHVGLVVDDMSHAINELEQKLGLPQRYEPTAHFAQVGDEHRHLVLVTRKRLWLPENTVPAEVFATEVTLHGNPRRELEMARYPYRISLDERRPTKARAAT